MPVATGTVPTARPPQPRSGVSLAQSSFCVSAFNDQTMAKFLQLSPFETILTKRNNERSSLPGNACGLYYKVNHNHRPYYMSKNKLNSSAKKSLLRCANCGTNKTTMWRKNGGQHVCNPCGLYIRLNGHNR